MKIRKNNRGKYVADCRRYGGGQPSFDTRAEAAGHLKTVKKKFHINNGKYVDPSKTNTVKLAIDDFMVKQADSVKTGALSQGHYNNKDLAFRQICSTPHGAGTIGDSRVGDLTIPLIEDVILPPLFKGAWSTGDKKAVIFKEFCKWIRRRGYNQDEPHLFESPDAPEREEEDFIERLSKEIIEKIIWAAEPEYKLLFKFAAYTGLRAGEIRALTWDKINFDDDAVKVFHAIKKVGNKGAPKTKHSRRIVPLIDAMRLDVEMREWKLNQPFVQRKNGWVFPREDGRLASTDHWRDVALKNACKKADVERIRFHDLRHFFASVLIFDMQETDQQIAYLMGHSSAQFTRRIYGHWLENAKRDRELRLRMSAAFKQHQ